jgi:hypothetical protein
LRHQHKALSELTADLTEQQLRQRINPDKWSAFEHIAHLAAYQARFVSRLYRIMAEDEPSFQAYVAEADRRFLDYLEFPLEGLFELIHVRAQQIRATLTVTFKDTDLLRTGLHPKYGKLTVPQWTEFYLLHEAHHLYAIFNETKARRPKDRH